MGELPRVRFWAHRDPLADCRAYEIGMWLFPRPRSEQVEGCLVYARFAARLRVVLPSFEWWPDRLDGGSVGLILSERWTGRRPGKWRIRIPAKIDFWRWA